MKAARSARQLVEPALRLRLPRRVGVALPDGPITPGRYSRRWPPEPASNRLADMPPQQPGIGDEVGATVAVLHSHQRSQEVAERLLAAA